LVHLKEWPTQVDDASSIENAHFPFAFIEYSLLETILARGYTHLAWWESLLLQLLRLIDYVVIISILNAMVVSTASSVDDSAFN
jgi:hypothetical protein